MKYIERNTVTVHRKGSLSDFLHASALASLVCHQQDTSPGAILLDHLVPNRWAGESFETWLLRQVREILTGHIQTDDWQEETARRMQHTVEGIEFDDLDRQWLLERYARHPEVLAVWEEACRLDHIRRLAA